MLRRHKFRLSNQSLVRPCFSPCDRERIGSFQRTAHLLDLRRFVNKTGGDIMLALNGCCDGVFWCRVCVCVSVRECYMLDTLRQDTCQWSRVYTIYMLYTTTPRVYIINDTLLIVIDSNAIYLTRFTRWRSHVPTYTSDS